VALPSPPPHRGSPPPSLIPIFLTVPEGFPFSPPRHDLQLFFGPWITGSQQALHPPPSGPHGNHVKPPMWFSPFSARAPLPLSATWGLGPFIPICPAPPPLERVSRGRCRPCFVCGLCLPSPTMRNSPIVPCFFARRACLVFFFPQNC